ncbi:MAG: TrmH family RNA methyltransferase [Clostridia bacterium]
MANIINITDFSDPRLDIYARLTEKELICKTMEERGVFVAESPLVIRLAMDSGCKPLSFLMEKKHIEGTAKGIIADAPADLPLFTAETEILTELTGFHLTRGVLAVFARPEIPDAETVCAGARRVAVLENVMNPANVGAIFRSAAALGMDAVLLTEAGSDPLTRRASRTSMGTVFQVPWAYLPPDISLQEALHRMGFKTAAMVLREDTLHLADPRLAEEPKLAMVLGNEGDGLVSGTIENCDYAVKIPMAHGVDSLNVATAAAIAFYQLGPMSQCP